MARPSSKRVSRYAAEVQRLCAETEGPVFVTENGAQRLVVMDTDCYKQYEQALWQMYEAKLIQEGLQETQSFPHSGLAVQGVAFPDGVVRKKTVNNYMMLYLPNDQKRRINILPSMAGGIFMRFYNT